MVKTYLPSKSRFFILHCPLFIFFFILHSSFLISPAQAQIPLTPIQPDVQVKILGFGRQAAAVGLGEQVLADLDLRVYSMKLARRALGSVGLIFIIMMLYAGFLWMTGGGSEERIEKAKKIMARSTIGVFLILTSYSIVVFFQRRVVRITFENALTTAQNCSTAGGQATCCSEWAAFQNESTNVPGLCSGATSWGECGSQFGAQVEASRGQANRLYGEWQQCMERETERAGLPSNLF